MKKKRLIIFAGVTAAFLLIGCENINIQTSDAESNSGVESSDNGAGLSGGGAESSDIGEESCDNTDASADNGTKGQDDSGNMQATEEYKYINSSGETLETRINPPEGFTRVAAENGSLCAFLRSYKMKPADSPVLLYDGREKGNQNVHAAVFELPIEEEDLQQCADSIMRVLGEYHYSRQEYSEIKFTLGGGFVADFGKWSQGNGISLSGDKLVWKASSGNDASYESFKKFMRMVFAYSGTLNMDNDSIAIDISEIQVGDIFIKGGSPGHVVMIADICENENGEKAFLLAQGYMPAQEFHVIKNPLHEENPWYYVSEITYPLRTAEYTFEEGSLKRYMYH